MVMMETGIMRYKFLLLTAAAMLQAFTLAGQGTCRIKVDTGKAKAGISDLFWGTNFLYWIEDDEALADGRIEKSLKELPCRILRYPGGTVADNYHWETNMLDNHFMFPYEEGPQQSDFEEFMAFCRRVGAEPMIVVNTQSWALKGDVRGGAGEAARWVRYCKEKGYEVKYWEIGNETYWHPVMTAKEYGELVNVYAEAMRQEDPDIVLSVNGHWDIDCVGTKERIPEKYRQGIIDGYAGITSREAYEEHKKGYEKLVKKPVTSGTDKWWPDLLSVCGENVDMLSVHWYYFEPQISYIDGKLAALGDYVKKMFPEKDFMLCMSEYNCNTADAEQRIIGLAESIGRFLNSGTDISCFWPLRMGGSSSVKNNRNMLGFANKKEQYPYQLFRMFQENLNGAMVDCTFPDDVYSFASCDAGVVTVVVSGRKLTDVTDVAVEAGVPLEGKTVDVKLYRPDVASMRLVEESLPFTERKKGISFVLEPMSFAMVTIK